MAAVFKVFQKTFGESETVGNFATFCSKQKVHDSLVNPKKQGIALMPLCHLVLPRAQPTAINSGSSIPQAYRTHLLERLLLVVANTV